MHAYIYILVNSLDLSPNLAFFLSQAYSTPFNAAVAKISKTLVGHILSRTWS